jgi:hypothetical protein
MTQANEQFAQCPKCRGLVAEDQSYCLSCGARQPNARFPASASGHAPGGPAHGSGPSHPDEHPRDWTPIVAVGGLAAMALILVIGVLIGKSGQSTPKNAATPIVTVAGNGGGPSANTATTAGANSGSTSINEDWPSGKDAWTVQLQTVPKSGATQGSVDSAKAAAKSKGASGVGVLDAANYNNIGSDYIIYSGVYDSQAKANAALGNLKKSFSSAKVIHVTAAGGAAAAGGAGQGQAISQQQQQQGAAQIQKITSACSSGNTAQCSKASKTTQPIATPGAPPPTDNKAPGGGSGGGQTFQ